MTTRLAFVFSMVALAPLLPSQAASQPAASQPTAPPAMTNQAALQMLQKACNKMSNLQGLHFSSSEEQENQFSRQIGGALGGNSATEVIGRWSPRAVELEIGDADEVVVAGTRMIARDDEYDWSLRRNCLASGGKIPFVFDPSIYFEVMQSAIKGNLEFSRAEHVTIRGKDLVLISVTVEDELAREMTYSGAVPGASEGGGMIMLGGLAGRAPKPDVTTDLAIYVDPESHLVHRLRLKSYQDSMFGGNVQIQLGGGGAFGNDDDEEEEVKTTDENGERIFQQGLPVREVGDAQSVVTYSIHFKDHDKPLLPELDDAARALLKMK